MAKYTTAEQNFGVRDAEIPCNLLAKTALISYQTIEATLRGTVSEMPHEAHLTTVLADGSTDRSVAQLETANIRSVQNEKRRTCFVGS